MLFEVARIAYSLLSPEGRRKFLLVPAVAFLASILQTASVATVPLFFAVAVGGRVQVSSLNEYAKSLGLVNLSLVALIIILGAAATSAYANWLGTRFAFFQYTQLSTRLLRTYLTRDYELHMQSKSEELESRVQTETLCLAMNGYQPLTVLVAKSLEVVMLTAALVYYNPKIALLIIASFGLFYSLAFQLCRMLVFQEGEKRILANDAKHRLVSEALSDLRSIKVFGLEEQTTRRFQEQVDTAAMAHSSIRFLAGVPKYGIESYILGGTIVATLVLNARDWSPGVFLPLLSLYAAAAVKMLPALQNCYYSLLTMRGVLPAFRVVAAELDSPPGAIQESPPEPSGPGVVLEFDQVHYRYPNGEVPALSGVDFKVLRGEKIGIVGKTGSGKTTLMDLALGLLRPTSGRVARLPNEEVGYVPQEILLTNDSLSANIARAWDEKKTISLDRLERAAKRAQILDFIRSLPEGFETEAGSRGSRLSGGQRQRIGIARALYSDPAVIFLDEASSALDKPTEEMFFKALLEDPDLTIVVIAHRLESLKGCDRILVLEEGRLKTSGSYDELLRGSDAFVALAG